MSDQFSKLNLNPNAFEFIPGRNTNAPAFVPGASFAAPTPAPAPVKVEPPKQEDPEDDWDKDDDDVAEEPVKEEAPAPEPEPEPEKLKEPEPVKEAPKIDTPEPEEPEEEPEEEGPVKDYVNVVFIGHVDAGKSTMSGQILKLTGMVDSRTLEKYERESKEKNRESWALSWCIDTNDEERDKGKTVEYGKAFFETEKKHFTILDAPGHKSFVPSMIEGASQADFAILIISARKGEFEAGFEKGGQTREHAMLVKTQGIKRLIIAVNKMDDTNWDVNRYNEILEKMKPWLLKQVGFKKEQLHFIPLSGFSGVNVKDSDISKHPWYKGPSLLDYLNDLPAIERKTTGQVRFCVAQKYKDMGHVVMGKLETGRLIKGKKLVIQPSGRKVKVSTMEFEDNPVAIGIAGQNLKIRLEGIENDDDVRKGYVLCDAANICKRSACFDGRVQIAEYKSIISEGFTAVLHLHTAVEEVTVERLLAKFNRKTKKLEKFSGARFLKQGDQGVVRFRLPCQVAMELADNFPSMGRFTLRDEGKTIAMGVIKKIIE